MYTFVRGAVRKDLMNLQRFAHGFRFRIALG
jgi:hypothetical protein